MMACAALATLAAILDAQEKHEEAEELYRRALNILESQLGQENYEAAVNLNNLAALNFRRGNTLLAEAFYWWAVNLKREDSRARASGYGQDH
jgi:tetratricopeptide (TPR) repeat protein